MTHRRSDREHCKNEDENENEDKIIDRRIQTSTRRRDSHTDIHRPRRQLTMATRSRQMESSSAFLDCGRNSRFDNLSRTVIRKLDAAEGESMEHQLTATPFEILLSGYSLVDASHNRRQRSVTAIFADDRQSRTQRSETSDRKTRTAEDVEMVRQQRYGNIPIGQSLRGTDRLTIR